MANILVGVVTVLYLGAAAAYLFKDKNPPTALVFLAYAIANIGLIWGTYRNG